MLTHPLALPASGQSSFQIDSVSGARVNHMAFLLLLLQTSLIYFHHMNE